MLDSTPLDTYLNHPVTQHIVFGRRRQFARLAGKIIENDKHRPGGYEA